MQPYERDDLIQSVWIGPGRSWPLQLYGLITDAILSDTKAPFHELSRIFCAFRTETERRLAVTVKSDLYHSPNHCVAKLCLHAFFRLLTREETLFRQGYRTFPYLGIWGEGSATTVWSTYFWRAQRTISNWLLPSISVHSIRSPVSSLTLLEIFIVFWAVGASYKINSFRPP